MTHGLAYDARGGLSSGERPASGHQPRTIASDH